MLAQQAATPCCVEKTAGKQVEVIPDIQRFLNEVYEGTREVVVFGTSIEVDELAKKFPIIGKLGLRNVLDEDFGKVRIDLKVVEQVDDPDKFLVGQMVIQLPGMESQ
jgi:hypothetical protein